MYPEVRKTGYYRRECQEGIVFRSDESELQRVYLCFDQDLPEVAISLAYRDVMDMGQVCIKPKYAWCKFMGRARRRSGDPSEQTVRDHCKRCVFWLMTHSNQCGAVSQKVSVAGLGNGQS